MLSFLKLETVTRRAPLGIRFVDIVREVGISDSLVVQAWQKGTKAKRGVWLGAAWPVNLRRRTSAGFSASLGRERRHKTGQVTKSLTRLVVPAKAGTQRLRA